MAHVHQRVVDNDGEVVCRVAVCPDNDWIADDVRVKPDVTTHDVGEDDIAVRRNAKSDSRPFPTLYAGARAVRRNGSACSCIAGRKARRQRRLSLRFEQVGGTKAVIRMARGQQAVGVRPIQMETL
jgi:hypothetical protein